MEDLTKVERELLAKQMASITESYYGENNEHKVPVSVRKQRHFRGKTKRKKK